MDEQGLWWGRCLFRGIRLSDHPVAAPAARATGAGPAAGVLGWVGAAAVAGCAAGDQRSITGHLAAAAALVMDGGNEGKPGRDAVYGKLGAGAQFCGLPGPGEPTESGT